MSEVPAGKHCPHSRSPSIKFCKALGDGLLDGPEEEVVEGSLFCCRKRPDGRGLPSGTFLPEPIIASSRIFSCVSPAADLGRLLSLIHEFE